MSDTAWVLAISVYLALALIAFMCASMWAIFRKAGEPGWAALIPIYNTYVALRVVGRPGWWLILLLLPIPIVPMIFGVIVLLDLARHFGRGTGFALGLIFLWFLFLPLPAFGEDEYIAGRTLQAA